MYLVLALSTLDIVMLITIPVVLLIGAGIFFLSGVYRVPQNHAIVMEKARQFYCVYKAGTYFKMPIAYQKVGIYCIAPQIRKYTANNGNNLDITFQIEDVQKYHYCGMTFENIMARIEKENSEINLTILTDTFNKYGLKFIGIKKSLN